MDVKIAVTYLKSSGEKEKNNYTVSANSRMTYELARHIPNGRASIMVTCITQGRKIICERAMYWDSRGVGTDTIGGNSDEPQ